MLVILEGYGNARVFESAEIYGNAKVYGDAMIYGNAVVFDDAIVIGNAKIFQNTNVYGKALVFDTAEVYGHAKIGGNARVYGNAIIGGNAKVFGDAQVYGNAEIFGNAKVNSIRDYMVFKNSWSSGRWFTWTKSNNMWKVGCFYGTGKQLIEKAYDDSEESGRNYAIIVNTVKQINNEEEIPTIGICTSLILNSFTSTVCFFITFIINLKGPAVRELTPLGYNLSMKKRRVS